MIDNILLFLPLGTILYRIYPKICILIVPALISIIIEISQFVSKTGICELSDIISNGLGGIIGYIVGSVLTKINDMTKYMK